MNCWSYVDLVVQLQMCWMHLRNQQTMMKVLLSLFHLNASISEGNVYLILVQFCCQILEKESDFPFTIPGQLKQICVTPDHGALFLLTCYLNIFKSKCNIDHADYPRKKFPCSRFVTLSMSVRCFQLTVSIAYLGFLLK